MGQVTVNLAGTDKENVAYVTIGTARWGQNGTDYGKSATVADGAQTIAVNYGGTKTDTVQRTVNGTVTYTVTANGKGHTTVAP